MLDAVPYSSVSILFSFEICSPGGQTRLIILVPAPRAFVNVLINFLIFHISIAFSSSVFSGTAPPFFDILLGR